MAIEEMGRLQAKGAKRPGGPAAAAAKKKVKVTEERKCRIENAQHIAWAEATLAPLGLREETQEPLVKSPVPVAKPILEGLQAFKEKNEFRELLKTTKIGQIVNAFRHHPNADLAKAQRTL